LFDKNSGWARPHVRYVCIGCRPSGDVQQLKAAIERGGASALGGQNKSPDVNPNTSCKVHFLDGVERSGRF